MKVTLLRTLENINAHLEIIDIESNEKLFEKYKHKIPVLTIDGNMFAKYRVDKEELRKKLAG